MAGRLADFRVAKFHAARFRAAGFRARSGGGGHLSAARRGRARGTYAIEFGLVLLGSLSLFIPVGEFLRVSLFDQALARATHQAARAAGMTPEDCDASIRGAFNPATGETLFRWLLDAHGDGTVGVSAPGAGGLDAWPDPSNAAEEVLVTVTFDEDASDAVDWRSVDWTASDCGAGGDWLRVRSRIVIRPWMPLAQRLWPDGFAREHVSWARNQRGG